MFPFNFWEPTWWLTNNMTWDEVAVNDKNEHTNFNDLSLGIGMAIFLTILRRIMDRFIFHPLAYSAGIKPKRKMDYVPILEEAYRPKQTIAHEQIVQLAYQLGWTERRVEIWLRKRHCKDKTSTLTKFSETGWRLFFYTTSFLCGLWTMWDKPWLWQLDRAWDNYPHQVVPSDVKWYFMTSLGFYCALLASQFSDVKRKDQSTMMVHHVATITGFFISWVCNLVRMTSTAIVLYDCADIFLEAAKLAKYAKLHRLCDAMFIIFVIAWFITRLVMLPYMTWHIFFKVPTRIKMSSPAIILVKCLHLLLAFLSFVWTIYIIKVLKVVFTTGQTEKDSRSSSSESEDSDSGSSTSAQNNISKNK